MVKFSIGLLVLALLFPSSVYPGYKSLKWNSSPGAVKRTFPHAKKMKPCYFEGVNVFDADSLKVAVESLAVGKIERQVFSFHKNGLVAVEIDYRLNGLDFKGFRKEVIAPIVKAYGARSMVCWDYRDSTKVGRCFLWQDREDVVLAVFGHFKGVSPDNLDWGRVKYYKRKFFNFRNQRKYCRSAEGIAKLFFR